MNGQDYLASYEFKFVDPLKLYRIAPLAGPIGGNTQIHLFGTGFNASQPIDTPVYLKFGTADSQYLEKSSVFDASWSEEDYYEEMKLNKLLLKDAEKNDQNPE